MATSSGTRTPALLAALLLGGFVAQAVSLVGPIVPIVGDVTQTAAEFRVVLPWEDAGGQAVVSIEGHGSGIAALQPESDRFAAWRAEGLQPGTSYRYTVAACNGASASGVFRTLPAAGERVQGQWRLAAVAGLMGPNICRHEEQGFPLSALRRWAPDTVLALGDMIDSDTECRSTGAYNQPQGPLGSGGAAVTMYDYLSRYQYIFQDEGLRELLSNTSYVATWDDGEILEGAGPSLDVRYSRRDNIPDGQHLLPTALAAMIAANPIQQAPNTPGRLYRSFQVGDIAEVFVLDLRQYRDAPIQLENNYFPKTMLGLEQKTWLWEHIGASTAKWKVLVSSVPLSVPVGETPGSSDWPSEMGRFPATMRDGWAAGGERGGYANELNEIMERLRSAGCNNVVWLSSGGARAEVLRLSPLEDNPVWKVYEVMVGPLNGVVAPGEAVDAAHYEEAESLFRWAPQERPEEWADAQQWLNFGGLVIQEDSMSVEIVNALGDKVFETDLSAVPNSEAEPLPEATLGGVADYTVARDAEKELVAYAGDVDTDSAVVVVMAPGAGDIALRYWPADAEQDDGAETRLVAERIHGFFAKTELVGLSPDTHYRYVARMAAPRANGGGELEATGSFRTMPGTGERKELKLAFFGDLAGQNVCRDRDDGFPALHAVAEYQPEVVIGLGDIVYVDHDCDDEGKFGNRQIPHPRPPLEGCQICLPSFWDKCRYNHEDRHFKAAIKDANFIGIWDDHEGVNDFTPYLDLRFNNEPSYPEGVHLLPFGLKGMLDCSPTMPAPNTPKRLYRHFAYGDTADIFVLDTRQYRDPSVQADSKVTPKTMLGLEQKRWLLETLARSRGTWKIMVTSMPLVIPTGSEYKPDKWESEMGPEPETWRDGWTAGDQSGGYENEMREILRAMADAGQRNVIFVATDVHCSFVYRHVPFEDDRSFQIHEIITGPVNADLFPKRGYSRDFFYQTRRIFQWHPSNRRDVGSWREAKRYFNFGTVEINRQGRLTADVRTSQIARGGRSADHPQLLTTGP